MKDKAINLKNLLLEVTDLKVHFTSKNQNSWFWQPAQIIKAVDGVSFELYEGETLGVVGESGSGKSTLARAIIGLNHCAIGEIKWLGNNLLTMQKNAWIAVRKQMQMVFQDPFASLNPRMTIGDIIVEPLHNFFPQLSKTQKKERVQAWLTKVGLLPNMINRYPHEFSGGQCQRIGIARALIVEPKLLICDEPLSALDVSIQAQIIDLLQQLQQKMGLSVLFIAHDLTVVKNISNRVMVMYHGNIVEMGEVHQVYQQPQHPYTKALLSAVPIPDPKYARKQYQNL